MMVYVASRSHALCPVSVFQRPFSPAGAGVRAAGCGTFQMLVLLSWFKGFVPILLLPLSALAPVGFKDGSWFH